MEYKAMRRTRKLVLACFLSAAITAAIFMLGASGTEAQAENLISEDFVSTAARVQNDQSEERAEITVWVDGKKYVYRDELLPAPDHTVYEQIERRNINAPLSEKILTVDKCLGAGAKWREAMRYAFPLLPAFVDKIKTETDTDAVNSEIRFRPDSSPMFSISRSRDGKTLDEKRLYQDIYLALRKGATAAVNAVPQVLKPEISVEDNIKLTRKISSFSTSFASSGEGRKNNIRLALAKINGTVIDGGEEFSFNRCVGPRTEKNGYSLAKIIVGGEYVEGVGGGVCQASTTVYNAALCAGMQVTCVRNHTIQPSYVPPSLDAMVNSSSSDLKFVNPYQTPVFIKAECSGDTARVTFYGAELPHVIKTSSRVISRTQVPPDKEITDVERKFVGEDAEPGTKVRVSYGHAGVKSEAYLRYFTKSGKLIKEEKIRSDGYAQTRGVVAVAG